MAKPFYITTTLPYVNAEPHIGFALELVQADIIARAKRLAGAEVFFNTGTDEHGLKIYRAAQAANQKPQDYADSYAKRYLELQQALNISTDAFIRTSSPAHVAAAQELWRRCAKNIEKRNFTGLYCVGCEAFLKSSDLVDGKCPDHYTAPEEVEEENYFFVVSDDQRKEILNYLNQSNSIIPESRRLEAINFVQNGFGDFSISRPKERLPWGIPVPGDDSQVVYVWFDALTNYISSLDWPDENGNFNKFWVDGETVQMAGKDQVRFQSLMWQVMLSAARIKLTDTVVYHGHITSDGHKMSKSIGNVVSPFDLVDEYGTDAVRYFLARHVNPFEDSDFTIERFKEAYNANLANGLGNLVSRVMTMAEANLDGKVAVDNVGYKISDYISEAMSQYRLDLAMEYIWAKIAELDQEIQEKKPWESKDQEVIKTLVI
ncbi:MAG: methionine--tRNA ligase, partial [Candidatus Vogelbacteria bacterium CG10_big_fil_rev_8_21_14_0_10_50_13]